MATLNFSSVSLPAAYVNAPDRLTVKPNSGSFTLPLPTPTIYVGGFAGGGATSRILNSFRLTLPTGTTYELNSGASAYTADGAWSGAVGFSGGPGSLSTSTFFNSSNPTERTRKASISCIGGTFGTRLTARDAASNASYGYCSSGVLTDIEITLDAPPTFDTSVISYDTPYVYSGLSTASVTVSDASAKYGGTISSIAFTIGNQTVTRSDNGTLSIPLDTGGVFTPTVTVTDSRGQTTTKSLDPITVNVYTAPSVSFTANRTLESGVPDDEGAYATVDATFTFADVIAEAIAPSVVLTDENGTQTTPTVTWFSSRAADGTLSGSVTWSSLSSGDTVYGRIPNVNTQYSYQISIRPRDDKGTGTAITQTLSSAFYTVDFLAGGHGIAFGKPASETGFECAMDATFDENIYIDLSDYQTTGSVDKELYDAIVALGWDSDVLVN